MGGAWAGGAAEGRGHNTPDFEKCKNFFFLKKDLGREGIKRAMFEDNGCGTSKDGAARRPKKCPR